MMHSMALMSDRARCRSLVAKIELWRTKSMPESSSNHTDRDRRVSPMRSKLAPRSKINARAQNASSVSGAMANTAQTPALASQPARSAVLLMNDLITHGDTDARSNSTVDFHTPRKERIGFHFRSMASSLTQTLQRIQS